METEWVLVKTFVSLAAVLGLMYGLVFVVKRTIMPEGKKKDGQVEIDVLGRRILGPKRSVVVLKVFDRVIVVGMTEDEMRTLAEMPDPRPAVRPPEETGEPDTGPRAMSRTFGDYLSTYLHVLPRRKPGAGISGRISPN
jgi:flagellar biosynthetic protein FliO